VPFIVDTAPKLAAYRAALAALAGLPRRGQVVGGPDYLPKTHAPGAPGWTEALADPIITDTGALALEIAAEDEKHLGKTVRVGGSDVVLPNKGALRSVKKRPPLADRDLP